MIPSRKLTDEQLGVLIIATECLHAFWAVKNIYPDCRPQRGLILEYAARNGGSIKMKPTTYTYQGVTVEAETIDDKRTRGINNFEILDAYYVHLFGYSITTVI